MKKDHIASKIKDLIAAGTYPRGALLPSERVMAAELGVSRPTLRRAVEALVNEGVLEAQAGRGTLVPDEDGLKLGWKIIALLLPDITNRFFSEVAEAIEYAALQRGYQILLCNSRHQPRLEEFHIRQFVERKVDGVIVAHDPNQEIPAAFARLRQAAIPTVLMFSSPQEAECDSVELNDREGVDQALRYLQSLGHRQIGFCRPLADERPHPREVHYREFMLRSGGAASVVNLVEVEPAVAEAELASLLQRPEGPTAFLAGNDNVAQILTKYLGALGLSVPGDVSVVGFDNLRFVQYLPVPLTTIDQPKQEMGRRAAELLFERIDAGPAMAARHEVFTPHLVIRESCAVVNATPIPLRGQNRRLLA